MIRSCKAHMTSVRPSTISTTDLLSLEKCTCCRSSLSRRHPQRLLQFEVEFNASVHHSKAERIARVSAIATDWAWISFAKPLMSTPSLPLQIPATEPVRSAVDQEQSTLIFTDPHSGGLHCSAVSLEIETHFAPSM
ncbi:hypothetical protein BT93_J0997 [Corymbia citriodora subsp. variegata]|nr:hypothetical protein BT93_J0997 [Corymbia citriodora subsp. variegata]